jgi:hypothetical protein
MRTQSYQKQLTSAEEAVTIGYEEGKSLRQYGAQPKGLAFNIEVSQGNYLYSPFYDCWLKGFRAGYLGEQKPIAP